MSKAHRSSKLPSPPSISEIVLGIVLSLVLGVLLAGVHLAAASVEKLATMPEEPKEGVVYYIRGGESTAAAAQWLRKRQLMVETASGEIELSEDELNTWAKGSFEATDGEDAQQGMILKVPNFRLVEGKLQVGMETEVRSMAFTRSVVVQVTGDFAKGEEGKFEFVPETVMLGRLPAHRIPGLRERVVARLWSAQDLPEDLVKAWGELVEVKVDGSVLKLRFP